MKKFQELLDEYGDYCKCIDWARWVGECVQHPNMVVDKFNEIAGEFRKQGGDELQISEALTKLKEKCYGKNWCRNEAHYMTLLGDNKSADEWLVGKNNR